MIDSRVNLPARGPSLEARNRVCGARPTRARPALLTTLPRVRKVVLGCFVLAALSLLLPARGLHFDSWAWVVWGRQIPLLELDTLGGPSWKPFPVVFTTVFAPFSKIDDDIPPLLWLVVARAGGFLSIAMAYRLASRLVGDEPWLKVTAGVVAAAVMCITPRWGLLIAQGFTERLAEAYASAAKPEFRRAGSYHLLAIMLVLAGSVLGSLLIDRRDGDLGAG